MKGVTKRSRGRESLDGGEGEKGRMDSKGGGRGWRGGERERELIRQ
jgi:hypothetical protein